MWHSVSLETVIKTFNTNPDTGLSLEEAAQRLTQHGPNRLRRVKKTPWWLLFLKQFNNPLVLILLAAAVITAWLKEYTDTSVILAAVLVNTGVGFYQEYRSGNIFEKLRQIVRVKARVLRNGKVSEVDAEALVPGDIVILKAGMKVPADGRLAKARALRLNEAILTGESTPVKKILTTVPADTALADRNNMCFMGTVVEEGEGTLVIIATGTQTEFGQIAQLTQTAHEEPTPLQQRIGHLGSVLTVFIGASALLIFVSGLLESRNVVEMFTLAVAVAVAAIPEGLPAAQSVVLAISSQRILKRRGLVKHILAAETLGSATVICSDKTGTITEGSMKLEKLLTESADDIGARALAFANEAVVQQGEGGWQVTGDPTDRAKMEYFLTAGDDLESLLAQMPRINFIPFDPTRKYIASFHAEQNSSPVLFVSGAPETLIQQSTSIQTGTQTVPLAANKREELRRTYEALAQEGYRVIAAAYRPLTMKEQPLAAEEQPTKYVAELTFIGLAAIRDPIREDVKETIIKTRSAGVTVVLVTGDHKLTAQAIGRELGLGTAAGTTMEAAELDTLTNEALAERIADIEIFARVNPKHKMRIIQAWQVRKASVAMTGDGINDAPALKAADIGVAVGAATDVTKEAADLVLLDNSFSIIVDAIEQGRVAFDNIRKVTILLLITSFTELVLAFTSLVFKTPLPITPTQILWANLVQDALPSLSLAFEPGEPDVMARPPVKRAEPIVDREGWLMIVLAGIISDLILAAVFLYLHFFTSIALPSIQTFVFAVLSLNILFYIFSIKSLRRSIVRINPFNNSFVIAAVIFGIAMILGAVYIPALNTLLKTAPLPLWSLAAVAGLSFLKVIILELIKWWFNARRKVQATSYAVAPRVGS